MVFLAIWVHIHEILIPGYGTLAENSPPAGAVGIFLGVLLIGTIIWRSSPKLRLTPAELIVIYTMLIVSAPLMSQGMWHRFLGLIIAIPEEKGNLSLVDSFSEKLWPHGPHLIPNRRFSQDGETHWKVEPAENSTFIEVEDSPIGPTTGIEFFNEAPADEDFDPAELVTTLSLRINRWQDGKEQLVPGERFYFNGLFRLSGLRSQSRLTVELYSDGDEIVPLLTMSRNTDVTFADKGGLKRQGRAYIDMPRDMSDYVDIVFMLEGVGRAAVTDITFFNNEALARMRKGSLEITESDEHRVPDNQKNSLLVRPDNLVTPRGIAYTLKGYIPYGQWIMPLAYWTSIVVAVFLCLLGISVIFRKQWADNERFSFPLVVLPRLLLEEKQDGGHTIRPLFRNRMFRVGAYIAFGYSILCGLAYYIPGMPNPAVDVKLAEYVSSPAAKAVFQQMAATNFTVVWIFVAVAFFIDLEMLASILLFFWLCKVPYYLGEIYGWKTIDGPLDKFPFPHEQHLGAFLGLAVIVLWVSRKHLAAVGRTIFNRPGGIDDSGEAMSYRSAAMMIVGSFIFFGIWGQMTGLGSGNALLFFGFLVVCGFSASRIRTECGAPATYFTPYFPFLIFYLLGGLANFRTETMVLAYVAGGFMAVAQFLMFAPSQVEMLHLGNQLNAKPSGIKWALIMGLLGGVFLGGYVMLVWAYGKGGDNIQYMRSWAMHQDWYLRTLRYAVADANMQSLSSAAQGEVIESPYPVASLIAAGIGVVVTLLLTFLRMHFVGFWLHPIGYVLANSHFAYMCWGSLLVAWIIKSVSLKVGGPKMIREQIAPMMVGVIVGCIAGMLFWDIVALNAMAQGVRNVYVPGPLP